MNNFPSHDSLKIALVIIARNESDVIDETVQLAKRTLGIRDALFVVADHCVDGTALVAKEAGAQVFIREIGAPNGKGSALAWFVQKHWNLLKSYSRLVILDADSLVSSDFITNLKSHLPQSNQVLQCFLCPIGYETSPVSTLIALSELVEQSIYNRIRSFFDCPIRLRGTGMVFRPEVFQSVCNDLHTEVEDIVLSLLIAEKGIKVKQLDSVVVYDPKPTELTAASRQRARWFRGQWAAFWHYRFAVLKIMAQGPRGWALLSALFLKPRWLMMAFKAGLAFACYQWPVLAAFWGGLFLADCLLILIGAFKLDERKTFFKAMLHLPEFVWMWLRSITLSFQCMPWLRVRKLTDYVEPGGYKPFKFVEMNKGKLKPPEPV